jgi:hypothetical protein
MPARGNKVQMNDQKPARCFSSHEGSHTNKKSEEIDEEEDSSLCGGKFEAQECELFPAVFVKIRGSMFGKLGETALALLIGACKLSSCDGAAQ